MLKNISVKIYNIDCRISVNLKKTASLLEIVRSAAQDIITPPAPALRANDAITHFRSNLIKLRMTSLMA